MFRVIGLVLGAVVIASTQPPAAPPDGKALFEMYCAVCHRAGGADSRAPLAEALRERPNPSIVVALETGTMQSEGAKLTAAERQAVADFLSPRSAPAARPAAGTDGALIWRTVAFSRREPPVSVLRILPSLR